MELTQENIEKTALEIAKMKTSDLNEALTKAQEYFEVVERIIKENPEIENIEELCKIFDNEQEILENNKSNKEESSIDDSRD